MPLPTDQKAIRLAQDLVAALDDVNNGVHPGYRPAHAKGILVSGLFTPSDNAKVITRAPHAYRESTPISLRFSDSAGIPSVADNDPQHASPRGIAIRFHLADRVHTDIIGHSHDGFPVRTAEEFLEFLHAAKASGPEAAHPTPIEQFVSTHPAALAFVQAPKPIPVSFAQEKFFSVNALKFISPSGSVTFGRFRVRPEAGTAYLDEAAAAAKGPDFLMEELTERLAKGPVKFTLFVQIAGPGDRVDDASISWPPDRTETEFGTITLTGVVPQSDPEGRRIIFDPIPRVDGIEPSGDPLLEPRAAVYLMSGRRRRAAEEAVGAAHGD